jgi:hypothetical protein
MIKSHQWSAFRLLTAIGPIGWPERGGRHGRMQEARKRWQAFLDTNIFCKPVKARKLNF